jgi:hypothetical protein
MVASGSRTRSLVSCIAGSQQSCRFSQSSGPRRSCVGTGPAFADTGVGCRAHGEGDRRSRRMEQLTDLSVSDQAKEDASAGLTMQMRL